VQGFLEYQNPPPHVEPALGYVRTHTTRAPERSEITLLIHPIFSPASRARPKRTLNCTNLVDLPPYPPPLPRAPYCHHSPSPPPRTALRFACTWMTQRDVSIRGTRRLGGEEAQGRRWGGQGGRGAPGLSYRTASWRLILLLHVRLERLPAPCRRLLATVHRTAPCTPEPGELVSPVRIPPAPRAK
jgi:hypothetical protein